MILLIDNYDSFTYNLYQYLGKYQEVRVHRNDKITIEEIEALKPTHIVISPGPGRPEEAGICVELIRRLSGHIPILGVCLGHQCIALAFDGKVDKAKNLCHGKSSPMTHGGESIFKKLISPMTIARYHSLSVVEEALPEALHILGRTEDGEIMAMSHTSHKTIGLQFHPESIMTCEGKDLIEAFVNL